MTMINRGQIKNQGYVSIIQIELHISFRNIQYKALLTSPSNRGESNCIFSLEIARIRPFTPLPQIERREFATGNAHVVSDSLRKLIEHRMLFCEIVESNGAILRARVAAVKVGVIIGAAK